VEEPFISIPKGGQTGSLEYQKHVDHAFYISRIIYPEFIPQVQTVNQNFYKKCPTAYVGGCLSQMSKKQSTDGSLLPLSLPSLRNNI
jgi:hypothetical protein